MTLKSADHVFETTITTGSGNFSLQGAVSGFRAFNTLGTNSFVEVIVDQRDTDGTILGWETLIGKIVVGTPDVLQVVKFIASSTGAKIAWGAGTKNVRVGPVAAVLIKTDENLNYVEHKGAATGTAAAQILASPYPITALSDGMRLVYNIPADGGGAMTLNYGGVGVKSIKYRGQDIPANAFKAGDILDLIYRATANQWELQNEPFILLDVQNTLASAATVSLAAQPSGNLVITGTTGITSFGNSGRTGQIYKLRFAGAVAITHNPTSLILPGGASFNTQAGDVMEVEDLGSNKWMVRQINRGAGRDIMQVQEQQNSGTPGGTFTSGSFVKRLLNTVVANTISGASLATNQITLPVGTYDITFWGVAFQVEKHKTRLQNITAGTTIAVGSAVNCDNGARNGNVSEGKVRVTLTETTVIELQHRSSYTNSSVGMGDAAGFGVPEIYSEVYIEKL